MALSFKRFIPYSPRELEKGIKRKPLDEHWKIIHMKMYDDDEDCYKISIQHKETKCESPELLITNNSVENKRHKKIGYVTIEHMGYRANFKCAYGTYDNNFMRAFHKVLRNPYFIMDLFNAKSKKLPYEYCTNKFGPIFDNPRCKEWQLHL